MKFIISRTSDWDGENKPFEDAYRDTYIEVDTRTSDCPTKIPAYYGDPERAKREWYGRGTNHRVENGHIKRDMEESDAWFIEINTLEELVNLKNKINESIILRRHYSNEDYLELEIYDDYRE